MHIQKVSFMAMMAASGFVVPGVAFAQTADSAEADDSNVIVVTARNREENIQEVPLAITAFDAEDISRQAIQELDDVARFTPGFSFEDFSGGIGTPVIRGQAQTRVTALESNVSTFLDGIYIPRAWAVDLGTTSLQRIEIVKGPQSARYGRNAFAGAINYIPRKAEITEEISGEIEGTIGSDERYDIGGFLNFSVNEWFALAGSYEYSSFDGSWENDHPFADSLDLDRGTSGNVGGRENQAVSISAAFKPLDGVRFEASYNHFNRKEEARANRYLAEVLGDFNCGSNRTIFGTGPNPALICGDLPAPGDTVTVDPRAYGVHSKTGFFRANLEIDVSDALTFSYLFGNVNGDVDIAVSGEPEPINCGTLVAGRCNFQNTPVGSMNYDSHEARLNFDNSGQFRGAIGVYYSDGTDITTFTSNNLNPIVNADDPFPGDPFAFLLGDTTTDTEIKSIFGEIHWTSANGALRLGAEGRYSETEITATDNRRALILGDTFKDFAPRFTAEYDLSDDNLLFATVAKGSKAGGFNPTALAPENQVFDKETNWTFEIGSKNTFLGGDLRLNGSIYYTDWNNIVISSPDPDATDPNATAIAQNLGGASIYGIELDAYYQITYNLSIDATFSHSEATYDDGTIDQRFARTRGTPGTPFFISAPCDDVVCNSNGDVGGNDIERTPPTQASFGIQWEGDIGSGDSNYYLRTDFSYQSDFFASTANVGTIPDRFLVNGSAGVNFGNFSVNAWIRNAFDKKYVSNSFVVVLPFGTTYGEFFGERRTFGMTGKVTF